MKTKHILALVVGIVCIAVLSVVIVLSMNKKPTADPTDKKDDSTVVDQPDTTPESNEQAPDNNAIDATDGSGDEKEPEPIPEPEPDPEPEPEPDTPTVDNNTNNEDDGSKADVPDTPTNTDPTVNAPSASPVDTTTKEGIQRILNDPFMLLVNRERKVNSDYTASDLVYFNDYQLNATCSSALRQLVNAGKSVGYSYILYSGYRTYSSQYNKYYNKIAGYKNQGYSEAEAIRLTNQYYAPPGGSEHHTGLAADVCIPSVVNKYGMLHENYEYTEEFKWFSQKYGFILRYPKGKESITGYNYEPWHYRYVGVDIATDIYNKGVTLEEYVYDLEAKLNTMN